MTIFDVYLYTIEVEQMSLLEVLSLTLISSVVSLCIIYSFLVVYKCHEHIKTRGNE